MNHYQPKITEPTEKTLKSWGDMFGEGENIQINDADLELDEFRKLWVHGGSCTGFDGYMVYGCAEPISAAAKANRLIISEKLRLFAEPSKIRNQFTVQYTGKQK